ncbi:uncharacterized protein LOC117914625 isoform X2 [Vitis riparia]|uniref:uncharacterized protein LOC117914625 isoform X2 n=1 Tax=Vitis riparia TaxID=96939 RepID=UPI00155A125D|nr:uncharacterized protein LOC117914625 isoform X2 [Vitis riparia]
MASHLGASLRATARSAVPVSHRHKHRVAVTVLVRRSGGRGASRIRVSDGGDSYLDMWKKAVDQERKGMEFQRIAGNSGGEDDGESAEALERKSDEFMKILEVSKEERDKVQRIQVIDRAAAAIAAARAILQESKSGEEELGYSRVEGSGSESGGGTGVQQGGTQNGVLFVPQSQTSVNSTPGPDFWSWTPPMDSEGKSDDAGNLQTARTSSPYLTPAKSLMEKEQSVDFLPIPFESRFSESSHNPLLPPLQSLTEVGKVDVSSSSLEIPSLKREDELGVLFLGHAAEAVHALDEVDGALSHGVSPDGSRWWRETGIEQRPDGVVCRWTLIRGVSADHVVEWEDKFWEAADKFQYKELGSEKSGRDATGNVWREYWKESMWQDCGLMHMEKTADKWGKNGKGDEWHEKWWEQYDASGKADKWAHKWCSIDPNTQLEAGHAHVWHERWGERYDGHGGSMKYTDKWAERCEGDAWTKWGDKWDENFDPNSHGVKQGETWWEGKHGERWNRTWGEGHNGSGWVHKYGKSSSGEHWDTHEEQDTWYERFPHYGFYHCFENSVQLREVQTPPQLS